MDRLRLILLVFLICVATSCQRTETRAVVVKIQSNYTDTVALEELFPNPREITLEENDSSLISWPGKIMAVNDTIIIADGRKLFRFSEEGKFISVLSRAGRGPGEYYRICDYDVRGNRLYIIDDQPKLLMYSLDGTFIKSEKLSFFPATICVYDDNNLILTSAYQSEVDKYHIVSAETLKET